MALIATVSKASVSQQMSGLWNIVMHLRVMDTGIAVIDADYSARFRTGDVIADKADELIGMMQIDVDKYVSEKLIFDNADLATLATTVRDGLNLEE